uniref:Adenine nucleotide translocase lysine methyltransferase n=1 Tax=Rousettus aegyptiacus TaxID=9407 RepID=A0A7J8F0E8_ROUAE|nr:hypothetical protein HJG63_012273 [Rousettus aegyptiacus]
MPCGRCYCTRASAECRCGCRYPMLGRVCGRWSTCCCCFEVVPENWWTWALVLAAHRCGLRPAVGYELNPWLVRLARLYAWRAGCASSVCYHREDLWKVSLRDCYNVSVFLAPSVLPLLEDKLQAELPEGARVVSGRFPLPTWQPVAVVGEGLDRVWAYDIHSGGPTVQASLAPSSVLVPRVPEPQAG